MMHAQFQQLNYCQASASVMAVTSKVRSESFTSARPPTANDLGHVIKCMWRASPVMPQAGPTCALCSFVGTRRENSRPHAGPSCSMLAAMLAAEHRFIRSPPVC